MENIPVKRQTKTAKKKLLIGIAIVFGTLLFLTCVSFLIDYIEGKKNTPTITEEKEINYKFYTPDFEEDIFKNQEYLELYDEGFIDFKEASITIGITQNDAYKYGDDTKFMIDMLYTIINGNNDAYNKCFSYAYFETHPSKGEFTMQMLYDIKIERLSNDKVESEEGNNYTKSVFSVEYKIYHNNGTFRKDIGDGSRKQYITLTNQSGQWLIEAITSVG